MAILDSRGRQIVRLIGFGDRIDHREPAEEKGWLGASSASGHTVATSLPVVWDERPVAKGEEATK